MNQIANLALVEWDDNASISKSAPTEYGPMYAGRFSGKALAEMYYWHALPPDWFSLSYDQLVEQRVKLMARVTRDGFHRLTARDVPQTGEVSTAILLQAGEGPHLEYKSTLRANLHTNQPDWKMELSVLKTIAGFLNTEGGTVLVGVDDAGTVLGLAADGFPNQDKMTLHLVNLLAKIGTHNSMYLDHRYEIHDGKAALLITCRPAAKPVFVADGQAERFYVRTLSATQELQGSHMQHYISERFG